MRRRRKMIKRIPKIPINTTIEAHNYFYVMAFVNDGHCSHQAVALDMIIDRSRKLDDEKALVLDMTPALQTVIDDWYVRYPEATIQKTPEQIVAEYAFAYLQSLKE